MGIEKKSFINIFNNTNIQKNSKNYIGMGNPDSEILFVGQEKALNLNDEAYSPIVNHESVLNFAHWNDIVSNHLGITDNFSPDLMTRAEPLNGFNPFSPMLFPPTAAIVGPLGGHTYKKIRALLNARNGARELNIFETNIFTDSIFSECFITEVSDKPSLTRSGNPMTQSRSIFVSSNEFYRSFKTVVVHVGLNSKDYIYARNSVERYNFLKINFNSGILNPPIVLFLGGNKEADVYENPLNNSKIIICHQLSGSAGWSNDQLQILSEQL
jgi:hypothetical protein